MTPPDAYQVAIRAATITLTVHALDEATGCCRACRTPGWCPIHAETAAWLTELHDRDRIVTASGSTVQVTFTPVVLYRTEDPSGSSGPGAVADGAVWDDGHAVIYWRGTTTGIRQEESFGHWRHIEKIHGHHGATTLIWLTAPAEVEAATPPP